MVLTALIPYKLNNNVNFLTVVDYRILRNEELNDLYSSPNIVRVIKSRRLR